jgi:hypothetical protein
MGEKPQPLHQKDAYGFHLFYYFRVGEYRHPLLHHHGVSKKHKGNTPAGYKKR